MNKTREIRPQNTLKHDKDKQVNDEPDTDTSYSSDEDKQSLNDDNDTNINGNSNNNKKPENEENDTEVS